MNRSFLNFGCLKIDHKSSLSSQTWIYEAISLQILKLEIKGTVIRGGGAAVKGIGSNLYHDRIKPAPVSVGENASRAVPSLTRGARSRDFVTKPDWRQIFPVALILMLIPIWNGFPLLYEDTAAYISRPAKVIGPMIGDRSPDWIEPASRNTGTPPTASGPVAAMDVSEEDDTWMAGRSVYWGTAAYLTTLLAGPFGVVLLSAFLVAITLTITWFKIIGRTSARELWVVAAALSLATPLGVFVGLMTPDALSGVFVVALAGLATRWDTLSRIERAALLAIACFAALSHDSIVAMSALLLPLAAVALWFISKRPRPSKAAACGLLATPLLVGILGAVVFHAAAIQATGKPPLRMSFLSAHIAHTEFGARAIRVQCKERSFEICKHTDKFPVEWTSFLFDRDPETGVFGPATLEEKRRLNEEQADLMVGAIMRYPFPALEHFAGDVYKQLATFDLSDVRQARKAATFERMFAPSLLGSWQDSRLAKNDAVISAVGTLTYLVVFIGLIAVPFLARGKAAGSGQFHAVSIFVGLIFVGIFANAIVSGIMASPWGRFEARLIWLVPFSAFALWAVSGSRHKKDKVCA